VWPTTLVGTLTLARIAGLREWQGRKYRTEDKITAARREYDRLTGTGTALSDIPRSEQIREAWDSWSTDRQRAAIRAVPHRVIIKPVPPGTASNPGGGLKDQAKRRAREMAILRQRVEFDWRV
jgi:hypothetical protein